MIHKRKVRGNSGAPPDKPCAPHVGCTPSMPLVRAGAMDREELAILTLWTARAAVTLNLCHWAWRPEAGSYALAQGRHNTSGGGSGGAFLV
jgi:hypothetical protein